jgi:transcriptional regulator with XRE-family HTH domain
MARRAAQIDRATRRIEAHLRRVLADVAGGRRLAGLSLRAIESATGVSKSAVDRLETYRGSTVDLVALAAFAAAVGQDVRLQAYPAGDPIRDAPQQRLLERLHAQLPSTVGWRTEVTLQIEGDLRAWDAEIRGDTWICHVEAETVLDDIQAVERKLERKRRDGGNGSVILLIADTRRNRRALAAAPAAFAGFSRESRALLRALRSGADPACDAILFI